MGVFSNGEKLFERYESRADAYIEDKNKSSRLLRKAIFKAGRKKGLKSIVGVWEVLQLLFSLFGDWIKGSYREVPKKSIVMIIVAILYFTLPTDAIADFIPFGGFIDDAAVIGFVTSQIKGDLEKYRYWKMYKNKKAD